MLESPDIHPRREFIRGRPPEGLEDRIVRFCRSSALLSGGYERVATRLVPFILAIVVVAPVGLLILPFFIPKFFRTARRRFGVHFREARTAPRERIERRTPRGTQG